MRDEEAWSTPTAKALRRKMTKAEVLVWSRLRRHSLADLKFRRQHPVGPYIVDFACLSAKLVVEIDGATHSTEEELQHDRNREKYLKRAGWNVLRFNNHDVHEHLDAVIESIFRSAPSGPLGPPPP